MLQVRSGGQKGEEKLRNRSSIRFLTIMVGAVFATLPQAHASESARSFSIYGFVQADAIYDFNRVDPDWEDTLRPSRIPTSVGAFGDDGQFLFSVKQTRFGVRGGVPAGEAMAPLDFVFEFDLFGVGDDAGETTFRLRHAYVEWGALLAGQTNSVFMDGDVFPNTIDYWGPAGMVFYRNVQLRWMPWRTETGHFAIAIERPGNDVDAGRIRELDPELGENLQGTEELPDLTAQWRTNGRWGHIQVAGILRKLAYETAGTPGNEPSGSKTGWGVNLAGVLNAAGDDKIKLQLVHGEGIASYMNDGGTDLAPGGVPGNVVAEAVPLTGVVAYYDHYWNPSWSSSIGYSLTQVDNTSLQAGDAFHRGEYASLNLIHVPAGNLMLGGELLWGRRTDFDGSEGEDVRFQFSVKYSFSANI
jgi:hypothetical protein